MHATATVTILGIQGTGQISENTLKVCTCVGENCDDRGCDCDEDSNSYLEQTTYMYKIYQFTNHADISSWREGHR